MYLPDGSLETVKARSLARTYAPLIAGVPGSVAMAFDAATGVFDLSYEINTALAPAAQVTSIFASAVYYYARGWNATVTPPQAGSVAASAERSYLTLTHAAGASGRVTLHLVPAA